MNYPAECSGISIKAANAPRDGDKPLYYLKNKRISNLVTDSPSQGQLDKESGPWELLQKIIKLFLPLI